MDIQPIIDHIRGLLDAKEITLVLVLGASRWEYGKPGGRRQVTARVVGEQPAVLELTADDPADADVVAGVLEQHVEVSRSGDRIHVDLTLR